MKRALSAAAFALSCLVLMGVPHPGKSDGLTVVELFTSQGCSSCPPADALLAELADREGILALSVHVDYWDYLGWEDSLASPETTDRQRYYVDKLDLRYLYTPQMVINGRDQVVGSHRGEVLERIAATGDAPTIDITLRHVGGGKLVARLSGGSALIEDEIADVWLFVIDDRHSTDVARGENRGRHLTYRNVVRSIDRIGTWEGEPTTIIVPPAVVDAAGDACAVVVQGRASGRVVGAARLSLAAAP